MLLKIFKTSLKNSCARARVQVFLWILRKFQEHLRCRPSENAYLREMKQCFQTNIFTEKHRSGCHLQYSWKYESLEFYIKRTPSQILSCKICEVLQSFSFTEHYLLTRQLLIFPAIFLPCFFGLLYQQYINSMTTSCLGTSEIATCKRPMLLALEMFKGNQKKINIVTIWGWGRLSEQKDV